jgi:uncharacterized membrane protein (UPF0127 family)
MDARIRRRRRAGIGPIRGVVALHAALLLAACSAAEEPPATAAPLTTRVVVAGEVLDVEVALDPPARVRGLSGRAAIPRNGGMLFVLPRPESLTMVMRDCPNPIDVAFIDSLGRVVAIHEMPPEPPRTRGETPFRYEQRLPGYASGQPVQFALETAGGRLAELGLGVGDRVHFDAQSLIERAR